MRVTQNAGDRAKLEPGLLMPNLGPFPRDIKGFGFCSSGICILGGGGGILVESKGFGDYR